MYLCSTCIVDMHMMSASPHPHENVLTVTLTHKKSAHTLSLKNTYADQRSDTRCQSKQAQKQYCDGVHGRTEGRRRKH